MSTEVWVDFFCNGALASVPKADVLAAFGEFLHKGDDGRWRAYYSLNHWCDVDLHEDESAPTLSQGVFVSRPLRDVRLWNSLFKIMRLGHGLLINPSSEPMMIASRVTIAHLPPDFPNPNELEVVISGSEIIAAFGAYRPRAALTELLKEERQRRAAGDYRGFGEEDADQA